MLKTQSKNAFRNYQQKQLFFSNFLRHPVMLGAALPSSKYLVEKLVEKIDWSSRNVIVEYGPGIGTVTARILERMSQHSTLVAVETNIDFVTMLQAQFQDPRLEVVCASAAGIRHVLKSLHLRQADYIVSSIPYTLLSSSVRREIIRQSYESLTPSGTFIVYQYTRAIVDDLKSIFGRVDEAFEFRNILPARLFYCTK